ncbi:MAG: division/cell wall cluster transcriptional repressor MraZ [Clostridia bacterium]|jgi:MraZ protein|nr:division/cell wall cluster transcriptional repressor MraZ [Clostridia bacterium]
MFFGEYSHALDEKGRIRIPSKLKAGLGEYVATKGVDNCIYIFSKSYFENEFLDSINRISAYALNGQNAVRAILSSTFEVEEDNQGRFVIPASLREFAGITKNVVSVGVGKRIEIWDEQTWKNYNNQTSFADAIKELNNN